MNILQKSDLFTKENGVYIMTTNNSTNRKKNNKGNKTNQNVKTSSSSISNQNKIKSINNEIEETNDERTDDTIKNISTNEESKSKISKKISSTVITTALTTVVTLIVSAACHSVYIKSDMKLLDEKLNSVNSSIDSLNTNFSILAQSVQFGDNTLNERLKNVEKKMDMTEYIKLTQTASSDMEMTSYHFSTTEFLSQPTWNEQDIIAEDESGNSLTASDLINKKILFGYEQDGQEIIFYGQYDSKNRWDGNCLLNVYKNNKLIMINDVVFDHGDIQSYKQIFKDTITNSKTENVWVISKRECNNEVNSGETYYYKKISEIKKQFELDNVDEGDLYYFDSFCKTLYDTQSPTAYYNGNTSDGKYNDTTGQAYLIKYNDDGKVIYLYHGMFKDGLPNDRSGKAWNIVFASKYNFYVLNTGDFNNGEAVEKSINPFSVEEISELLSKYDFGDELSWITVNEDT